MPAKTAILIGATGLVGSHCLQQLLASPAYGRVIAVSRRPIALQHEKLQRLEVGSFDNLGQALQGVRAYDAFCCLGTTIRQAGTKAEFHKVDYGYALEFAHRMRRNGARHFLLVSALGAQANSPVFYNRVKGLLEKEVAALGFARTSVFRPSLLLGPRAEQRRAEALGLRLSQWVTPLMVGPLRDLHPVSGAEVAAAMVACAQVKEPEALRIYRYDDMQALLA